MLAVFLSTIIIFVSTSVDYLFLLFIAFSQTSKKNEAWQVVIGYYLGTLALIIISLILSYALSFIPQDWVIGLLGFLPIMLGIQHIRSSRKEETRAMSAHFASPKTHFIWPICFITIASGGDNIGIYIPYFLSLTSLALVGSILLLLVFTGGLLFLSYQLARLQVFSENFHRYEAIIVPVVYFALGFYILIDLGTLQKFLSFLFV